MNLAERLNKLYLEKHVPKEESFWSLYMGLKDSIEGDFEQKEKDYKNFISSPRFLPEIRKELKKNLPEEEKTALTGWLRFFEANAIESPEAADLQEQIINMEGELGRKREAKTPGYADPVSGEFQATGSSKLSLLISNNDDEKIRKAAWEGLRQIEKDVLDAGFLDIVKERNRLGRLLGYSDYYEYKVRLNEQMSKKEIFDEFDNLLSATKQAARRGLEAISAEKGPEALKPWNYRYNTSGDLNKKTDPYFPFSRSLETWGRFFSALNIRYQRAELQLDLLYRKGKYENGFMHGPYPAHIQNGRFKPARINFTAVAHPNEIGGGRRALETLFHEGGHAAHFANIRQPAACFSQEFAPTSVALAETQSMFMDSFLDDPSYLAFYAEDDKGNRMPTELIEESVRHRCRTLAMDFRSLLAVPYAEKAIYEIPDQELTAERVLEAVRNAEQKLFMGQESPRPVLSVPHLLSGESSAYYHAYILAWMGVLQIRKFFYERDGFIVNNDLIGPDLAKTAWIYGNERNFPGMIRKVTGRPFSAAAAIEEINRSEEEAVELMNKRISLTEFWGEEADAINLDARIRMVHGDTMMADNSRSFSEMCIAYNEAVRKL